MFIFFSGCGRSLVFSRVFPKSDHGGIDGREVELPFNITALFGPGGFEKRGQFMSDAGKIERDALCRQLFPKFVDLAQGAGDHDKEKRGRSNIE